MEWRTREITLSPRRIFQCLMSFSAAFHPIFLGAACCSPARVWDGGSGGQKYAALRRPGERCGFPVRGEEVAAGRRLGPGRVAWRRCRCAAEAEELSRMDRWRS